MRRWIFLLIVAGCVSTAWGQLDTLWVEPAVSPSVIKLGEPFTLIIRFSRMAGDTLEGPGAPMAMGPLDLRKSEDISTADSLAWKLEGALFDLGDIQLPAIPFLLHRTGVSKWVVSRPYLLTVTPTAPDTARALRDLKPPVPTPLRWEWFMLVGTLLGVALLFWAVWFWRKHRLDPEPWVVRTPRVPPHVEAQKALRKLEDQALPVRGLVQEHYYRLSGILRAYMERRFQFPAAEWTTHEIAPELDRISSLGDPARIQVLEILDRADLAKFAKVNPGVDISHQDLARAQVWVEQTREIDAGQAEEENS